MARNMASLLSKPMTPAPPDDDASGGEQAGGSDLQSLMNQGGQQQGGQGPAAPTHEHLAAILDHLGAFQREWANILHAPGIGKVDEKGAIMESIASLMGDGYITLAQSMSLLKDLPTTPLGQKQWAQEHLQKDEQAAMMVLEQSKAMGPSKDPIQPLKSPHERNHQDILRGAVKFYDHHNPSKRRR